MLIASTRFEAQPKDVTWALIDGEYTLTWLPTPGMENRFLSEGEKFPTAEGPCFNEVLTSAAPYKATQGYDYFELTNTGKKVSLKGWTMRLGMAGSKSYALPSESLAKGAYRSIYCTDNDLNKNANTGFGLPAQGAILTLWNSKGELVDFVRLPWQYANISWGLGKDGETWGYFSSKTMGKANGVAYADKLEAPVLSLMGGVYDAASVTVAVSAPEGITVRYTTDGCKPTSSSAEYTGPLTFTKTTAFSAAAFAEGELCSDVACATYVLGLDIKTPVVCLIIDDFYLYNATDGVITGSSGGEKNYKKNWEYPANFEYFNVDGGCELNQYCGFGIQGDSSRGSKQKAFQLVARKSYGTEEFFYFNPFENRSFDRYKSLNLRAAGSEGPISTRFRDAYLSTLAEGSTSLLTSAAQPVLVYLNGQMYGQYNLRERINKWFVAQHLGIEDETVIDHIDLLCETGDWVRNGSNADYKALSRFMKRNDLNKGDNLQYVLDRMDVQSYFEYVAFMMCSGNRDLSNTRFYRVPDGKWTWVLYDLDKAMDEYDSKSAFWLYTLSIDHSLSYMTDHVPFVALMKVPQMKDMFLTILGNMLADCFMPSRVVAGIDEWHDRMEPLMPFQLKRWTNDNMHYWESLVKAMRTCAEKRPEMVIKYTKQYFKLNDAQIQTYFARYYEKLAAE